jgi:hypothetical protein
MTDERCNADLGPLTAKLLEQQREIDRLKAERDDARRMYCRGFTDFCPNPAHAKLTLEQAAMRVAKELGWDCFKSRTPRVCDAYTK